MNKRDLRSGDVVWVDFDPAFGHEQSGRRPALVMSTIAYNQRASAVLVCPITSSVKSWPFRFALPTGGKISGYVLFDQIKSIDKRRVKSDVIERLERATFDEIRLGVSSLVSFDPPGA